jgi:hypothetical protein
MLKEVQGESENVCLLEELQLGAGFPMTALHEKSFLFKKNWLIFMTDLPVHRNTCA